MDTMREELVDLRIKLLEPTEGEKFEAEYFVEEVLERLYKKQINDDPTLDVCAVALKFDGEYYQVIPWDPETLKFISRGESKIPERLLDRILGLASAKGAEVFPQDMASELGIISEEEETDPLEKKWGWKRPKEEKSEKKKDWYLLYDVSIHEIRSESTKKPQKETG